jgi:tetratricopeptide (TPR) repeat protein
MNIKKLSSIFIILLFTLLLGVNSAEAIPASVKAKSEYLLADRLFNDGDFTGAIKHAEKSLAILGKTNSRIQYLLTKAYVATDQPDLAFAAIESFFEVTPESMSGSDQYNEMVEQYSIIEESVQKLRALENEKKIAQELLEKKEKILQKIKCCRAICEADSSLKYNQRRDVCFAEAKKKNKAAGEAISEAFEVKTVDELAKPCIESAGNIFTAEITPCWDSCEKEKFRQKKLEVASSGNQSPIILGESHIMGYTFGYQNYAIEISKVSPNSPAEIAGLAAGDFIVAVDGNPIEYKMYINDIRDKIISGELESAVLEIRRGDQKMEYLVKK